jgi:DNA invertase Pin-like site-specific DNA recombinase
MEGVNCCDQPTRKGEMKKELDKKLLKQLYTKEGKSLAKIAEILSCSSPTVRNRCVEYGIPIREPRNSDRLAAKTRVPKAVYIREAVDLALKKHERPSPKRQKK